MSFATINSILHLTHYFPDIDPNIVVYAFKHHQLVVDDKLKAYITAKYGRPVEFNYQILEFYGDAVLELVVTDIIREFNKLGNLPSKLAPLKSSVISNQFLRKMSHSIKLCDRIFNKTITSKLDLHNVCSDSFEAILGAIYYQYGLAAIPTIRRWLIDTFPGFKTVIKHSFKPIRRKPRFTPLSRKKKDRMPRIPRRVAPEEIEDFSPKASRTTDPEELIPENLLRVIDPPYINPRLKADILKVINSRSRNGSIERFVIERIINAHVKHKLTKKQIDDIIFELGFRPNNTFLQKKYHKAKIDQTI